MTSMILGDLPLGLDGIKIALHLLNFAILMVGLTILLYKPVLKFIKKREDTIKNQLDENEKVKKEADEKLSEYQTKLDNFDAEINKKKEEELQNVNEQKELILADASKQATNVLKRAEEISKNERKKAIKSLHSEVANVAVNIAGNILEREISKEENAKIIDDCINKWSEDE
jgi:F-type H+-transporting ATPase subunit b